LTKVMGHFALHHLVLPAVIVLTALLPTSAHAADCATGTDAFVVDTETLCVPGGSAGYAIRSADPSLLRFGELYFVGTTRILDADRRTLTRPDGTKVSAVLMAVQANAKADSLRDSVGEALRRRLVNLRTGKPVTILVDGGFYGEMTLQFTKREDGKFEGRLLSADPELMPFDYWLAAAEENGSIDYVLRCSKSDTGDRLQYACGGEFRMRVLRAVVSLFAPRTDELDDTFEATREIILSLIAR
jgi:hypothetical protein